jgi:hypothetical protein
MLALFRNNRATTALVLFFYVLFTRLPSFLGYVQPNTKEIAPGGMLWQTLFGWLETDNRQAWSLWIAIVLVFIQAVWINYLANTNRIADNRTWYPGVAYVLLTAFLPEFLYASPPLMAVTFVPIALQYIFKAYKLPEVRYSVLDTALWLTVGSFFYPPMFSLVPAGFISLLIVRSFKMKERIIYLAGTFTAFFLGWLSYYWVDQGTAFWRSQINGFTGWYHFSPNWEGSALIAVVLTGFLVLMAVVGYGFYTQGKLIQVRSYIQVLYVFLITAGLSILLQGNFYNTHLLLLIPSASIMLSMTLIAVKRISFTEILHFLLLVTAFSIQVYGH